MLGPECYDLPACEDLIPPQASLNKIFYRIRFLVNYL